jgi:hypothetical protein
MSGPIRRVKANRLEPGVALRTNAVLFGNLALEEMGLGTIRRHRRKAVAIKRRTDNLQCPVRGVRHYGVKVEHIIRRRRVCEERSNALSAAGCFEDRITKVRNKQRRDR